MISLTITTTNVSITVVKLLLFFINDFITLFKVLGVQPFSLLNSVLYCNLAFCCDLGRGCVLLVPVQPVCQFLPDFSCELSFSFAHPFALEYRKLCGSSCIRLLTQPSEYFQNDQPPVQAGSTCGSSCPKPPRRASHPLTHSFLCHSLSF